MGTSVYPGALDDFAEASPPYLADDDTTGRDHPARHDDIEAAMEAVQGELGTDPSGGSATVKARLDAADSTVSALTSTVAGKAPLDSPAFTGTVNFTGTSIIGLPVAGLSASPPTSIANSGGTASLSGNTVTFAGVLSVSLNGCFTGEYDNYRVILRYVGTPGNELFLRWRTSSVDNTTAGYAHQSGRFSGASADGARVTGGTSARLSYIDTGAQGLSAEIITPFPAQQTAYVQQATTAQDGIGIDLLGHRHTGSTSFDGFTLYATSPSTLSGNVSVYGYKP